ncbi:MAG: hypothetical protein KA403_03910 [Candidatus Omnitrophica bacterium]|nr:hypothetical protein [Candidatus Omnitrophota bacterium]
MIRALLYSFLIMIFFGFLLLSGLFGQEQGRIAAKRISDFFKWRSATPVSLVSSTDEATRKFTQDYQKIQVLRQMTLERNEQALKELGIVYDETRKNLKELLLKMEELSDENRKELMNAFTALHQERTKLVEAIILDQQIMINLNEQMEQQLQMISQWLNQKADEKAGPSMQDMKTMRQYEALRANLGKFNEQSAYLDATRILFLRKSKDWIDRLAQTNKELENNFRELLYQIELSTSDQGTELWEKYQRLETEQRELVGNLRTNEDYISENQSKVVKGITVISEAVQYSSETQLKRFRDNYVMMESRRREMLRGMQQSQQAFLSTRPSMAKMMEDNRFKMETLREQARHVSSQYEQMEEYRRSASNMLNSMNRELKDKNALVSQQNKDIIQRSQDRVSEFMTHMDSARNNIDDLIKNGAQTVLADSPAMHQLKSLQEKNVSFLASIRRNEEQMRTLRDQTERDQSESMEVKKDANKRNAEMMRAAKERTEDQQRIAAEKVQYQLQQIKDKQMDQKWNVK